MRPRLLRFLMTGLALLAGAFLSAAPLRAESNAGWLPPSWRMGGSDASTMDQHAEQRTRRSTYARPWYEPRFALGVGLNVPELLPIEAYAFFGRYFGVRLFYTPPLPFKIRVEMPSDVISVYQQALVVANPDFEVRADATYGAHYGAEALVFPFGGSFFIAAGISHRRMRLIGDAQSPVLVCPLLEGAKEDPCSDPDNSIKTHTQLAAHVDADTEALLTRGALGWFWHVGRAGYFTLDIGMTHPSEIHRSVTIKTGLDVPETDGEEIVGALAQVKSDREADLRDKAVKAMLPVEEKNLPILGIGAGIRF